MANKKGILEKTVGKVVEGTLKGADNLLNAVNPFAEKEKKATKKTTAKPKTASKSKPTTTKKKK
jgi:small nuclear ribonucleoprotein (snRNP)-like protein